MPSRTALSLLALLTPFVPLASAASLRYRQTTAPPIESVPTYPNQNFTSVAFKPPVFTIDKTDAPLADGLIFITPAQPGKVIARRPAQRGPIIATDDGTLIWNGPPIGYATNLRVQTYQNKSVISYFGGVTNRYAIGYGNVTILDNTYTPIATICPKVNIVTPLNYTFPCYVDLHEGLITDRDSIMIIMANVTTADLRPVGGPQLGWVLDSMFFEVDIATNDVLFSWSPLQAGVPINSTHQPLHDTGLNQSVPFDWMHMNSVRRLPDGTYLANARYTWSTYRVSAEGKVNWTINGDTGGDFTLADDVHFSWQHDAQIFNETAVGAMMSYFDNAATDMAGPGYNFSAPTQGLILSLNYGTKEVSLVQSFSDPLQTVTSVSQGSFQRLDNGNIFMGYGSLALLREYGPEGDVRLDMQFGDGASVASYRGFRQVWHATPAANPVVVVQDGSMYVTWNGATDVTGWKVYSGETETTLVAGDTAEKKGFETTITVPEGAKFVQVAALEGEGATGEDSGLRKSDVVAVPAVVSAESAQPSN